MLLAQAISEDAIFVTHEHSDHIQGLGLVSKKFNIPVFEDAILPAFFQFFLFFAAFFPDQP